ncbi:hypothetical protein GPJ56_000950 [Histomonas meleagridis]|uniref:uncharacterized protein n=1 Tax=Histomonas meleagridis TaxID=135588 RepID=UPI00355A2A95|nr:hypothetical protein GPJ56_000950 [Histomonas meleagridis]KAH0803785.1 hypothetical protein GO595_002615 [Histomonas meleagridis]
MEIDSLTDKIQAIYSDFIAKLMTKCQEIRSEIQEIHSKHRQAMKAFGISETDINEQLSPIQPSGLIKQLEDSKREYTNFQHVIADRVQKIENLIHIANELFDSLDIPVEERGEFYELGEIDFTRERVDRFRSKIELLKKEKEENVSEITKLKSRIKKLLKEMDTKLSPEESQIMNSTLCSKSIIESLSSLATKYKQKKDQRTKEISEVAITITHLWDLLNIGESERKKFLSEHSTLGDDVLMSCNREVEKLSKLRDEKLPELIAAQRREVEKYWNLLHIADESRPRFEPKSIENEKVEEFNFLESEIIRLKKLSVEWHPILESINQRESILSEYYAMEAATNDPSRLMSRERGCAQQLIREEKARRRYKVVLPRLEKKIYQLLVDYKQKHGTDFEWDGKPYIEQLSHVQMDEIKPKKISSTRQTEAEKKTKTIQPTKKIHFAKNNENTNVLQKKAFSVRQPTNMNKLI